jgi:hypothetical protein
MKESKKEKHKNKVRRRNIKRKCAFLRGLWQFKKKTSAYANNKPEEDSK